MNYDWNWRVLLEFAPGTDIPYWATLVEGTWWTLKTALMSFVVALVVGVPVGTARTFAPTPITRALDACVEVFRNIPLLVQMFLWFFVVPELVPSALGDAMKSAENSSFYTAVASLGLFTSARVAEQVKAGIQSLPRGQLNAALALGLPVGGAYRFVLLPQAMRVVLPPLTSEMVNVVKNSSVALAIGLMELTAETRAMQEFSFRIFESFTVATVIYLLINTLIVVAMGFVERVLNRHRADAARVRR